MRISDWSSDVCSSDLLRRASFREPKWVVACSYIVIISGRRGGNVRSLGLGRRHSADDHGNARVVIGAPRRFGAGVDIDIRRRFRFPRIERGLITGTQRTIQPVAEPIGGSRSEEHTSEIKALMRSTYAVFCLQTK